MKPFKIFIVDDDPLYIAAFKLFIESNTSEFVEIYTYITGEKMLKDLNIKPDLIFLDFYLNGKIQHARNGLSILKKILYRFPYSKIIIVSSQSNIEMALKTIETGADKYLVKDHSEFTKANNIISEAIKMKQQRRSKFLLFLPFLLLMIVLTVLFLLNRLII